MRGAIAERQIDALEASAAIGLADSMEVPPCRRRLLGVAMGEWIGVLLAIVVELDLDQTNDRARGAQSTWPEQARRDVVEPDLCNARRVEIRSRFEQRGEREHEALGDQP